MSRTVTEARSVALDPAAALELWRDVRRWSSFVEGFARLERDDADWPEPGARVVWASRPGGRGTVTETVADCEPTAFATDIIEKRLLGTQRATFALEPGGGSRMTLTLDYDLTTELPLSGLFDLLFVRRQVAGMLARTLNRFAIEAAEQAELGDPCSAERRH